MDTGRGQDAAGRSRPAGLDEAVTYAPTGGTLADPPVVPPGYHGIDERVAIGRGSGRYTQAVDAVFDWQVQRRAGVRVRTDGPPRTGRRVALRVGVGPIRLSAPVIVVATAGTDEQDAAGRKGIAPGADPAAGDPVGGQHPEGGAAGSSGPTGPREVRRCGFAYGTCPGHPESGEEAFLVEWDTDDVVWLRVIAFSRPATWYVRLAGPAARGMQAFITRRYLRSLAPRMTG